MVKSDVVITRRAFVSSLAASGLLRARHSAASGLSHDAADIILRIEGAKIEVASGRTIATATYNGTAPGPIIRMREGVTASVEIHNQTDVTNTFTGMALRSPRNRTEHLKKEAGKFLPAAVFVTTSHPLRPAPATFIPTPWQ